MRTIYQKPRTGKTTQLIDACLLLGGCIVCADEERIKIVQDAVINAGFTENDIIAITFTDFVSVNYDKRKIKCFFIDDVNESLRRVAGDIHIAAIAVDDLNAGDM